MVRASCYRNTSRSVDERGLLAQKRRSWVEGRSRLACGPFMSLLDGVTRMYESYGARCDRSERSHLDWPSRLDLLCLLPTHPPYPAAQHGTFSRKSRPHRRTLIDQLLFSPGSAADDVGHQRESSRPSAGRPSAHPTSSSTDLPPSSLASCSRLHITSCSFIPPARALRPLRSGQVGRLPSDRASCHRVSPSSRVPRVAGWGRRTQRALSTLEYGLLLASRLLARFVWGRLRQKGT